MKRKINAWCWRSGQIEFGQRVPDGAMHIANGDEPVVREVITQTARLAHDNLTLLVPGVPEATSEDDAMTALCRYVQWLGKRNSREFRAIGA